MENNLFHADLTHSLNRSIDLSLNLSDTTLLLCSYIGSVVTQVNLQIAAAVFRPSTPSGLGLFCIACFEATIRRFPLLGQTRGRVRGNWQRPHLPTIFGRKIKRKHVISRPKVGPVTLRPDDHRICILTRARGCKTNWNNQFD